MAMGLPMVGLVHVGMGSFLSMQAYFGATFMDGIGPVTGVGLIRNLAPLMTGFILAGVVSSRYVAELGGATPGIEAEAASLVASRLLAATVAGPVLAVWGSLVGIAIGWAVANQMMGLTLPAFFDMFLEMLWVRDIVGLVVKGAAFGFLAALLACHEGLPPARRPRRAGLPGIDLLGRLPGDLPGRPGDPGLHEQRLVPPGLPRRAGLRPDGPDAAEGMIDRR